jgi:flagellar protein FlbD
MIHVTRLDGSDMVVNVDQIAWIEGTPDTVISLMNGEKLLVREAPDQLIARAKAFKRAVSMPPTPSRTKRASGAPAVVRRFGELAEESADVEHADDRVVALRPQAPDQEAL